MNLDVALVWVMSGSVENVEKVQSLGIEDSDIEDAHARKAFSFISEHYSKFKSSPTMEAITETVGDTEMADHSRESFDDSFIVSEVLKRKLYKKVKSTVMQVEGYLRSNDPEGAFDCIKGFADSGDVSVGVANPTSIFDLAGSVLDSYNLLKQGFMGVELPWKRMNDMMMGMWPGTATYFVARPGVGKTQVAILCASKAWRDGKRVLIFSPEMSKEEIAERYFILDSDVSAENVIKGTLSSFEIQRLEKTVEDARGKQGVWVMDSTDDLSPGGMDSAIRATSPDLVAVDSIYMLKFKGDKAERTGKAVDWIRTAAKRFKVPFICFHQMNRSTTKDKKYGGGYDTSNIALSDQLLWDAQAVFLMEQDKDMKADKRLRFHVGKLRRGTWDGKPIDVNWDFGSMNFSEIEVAAKKNSYSEETEKNEFSEYESYFDDVE